MTSQGGRFELVFNGEIYNYKELRELLLAKGHTLQTEGDTETIVHLYEEYGDKCVEHLRGMFAFCVVDLARRRCLSGSESLPIATIPTV